MVGKMKKAPWARAALVSGYEAGHTAARRRVLDFRGLPPTPRTPTAVQPSLHPAAPRREAGCRTTARLWLSEQPQWARLKARAAMSVKGKPTRK